MTYWCPPHRRMPGRQVPNIKIRSNVITCRAEWHRVLIHAYDPQPLLRVMYQPGLWIVHNKKLGIDRAEYTDVEGNEWHVGTWQLASHNVQDWPRGEVWLPYDYTDPFYQSGHRA